MCSEEKIKVVQRSRGRQTERKAEERGRTFCDEADKEEEAGGRQRERGGETDGGGEEGR